MRAPDRLPCTCAVGCCSLAPLLLSVCHLCPALLQPPFLLQPCRTAASRWTSTDSSINKGASCTREKTSVLSTHGTQSLLHGRCAHGRHQLHGAATAFLLGRGAVSLSLPCDVLSSVGQLRYSRCDPRSGARRRSGADRNWQLEIVGPRHFGADGADGARTVADGSQHSHRWTQ